MVFGGTRRIKNEGLASHLRRKVALITFIISQLLVELKKLFLVFLFTPEDFEDEEEEGEDDEEEEPERADDDHFIDFRFDALILNIVDDVEDTDGGGVFPRCGC